MIWLGIACLLLLGGTPLGWFLGVFLIGIGLGIEANK